MKFGKEPRGKKRQLRTRLSAALLSFALLLGLAPALGPVVLPTAHAEDWMQEYLDKLVSWGVMRGDIEGNLRPYDEITRAEFVTLVNRAYGYDELGPTPFSDVPSSAWYAEDIGIAYTEGYFSGTSANTASPGWNLSREEAAVVLGRNMMLQVVPGEVTEFTDSRNLSEWSRGLVQAVAKSGVVTGYPDGSFRPQQPVTRGEVAVMLVRAIGTPIQEPGEHILGNVYGNLTITTAGVTLRDTTIAGDLYLTGGIGLGDLLLENVTVLGKIVVSGAGESHKGDTSITMRNVTANEMVVDSLSNQFVTIRADGDTEIWNTTVRAPAFIEDVTGADKGLKLIEVRGDEGLEVQLAGGVKEVINYTPKSNLKFTIGSADKVTVDEKAVNSTVTIENGAHIKELNLDVGTKVTGKGDIAHLNVNAPGVKCDPLPDTITIRPGVTADIYGGPMDTEIAKEHSMDPRILAGYPTIRNVSPKGAEAIVSTNKRGTLYWAISGIADGSVSEDDLLSPPAYAGNVIKHGNLRTEFSKTEYTAKLSGLNPASSYYLTSMLVDDRGERSPMKVTSFTTPDDSVPKFASGYPYMSKITHDSGQVTVMASKTCTLYWALLPKGSTAPKPDDFKTGALGGNLGAGSKEVEKNAVSVIMANSKTLRELETYDLYLCLIDNDGVKNSGVKKLSFTTKDGTPPIFLMEPTPNDIKATSVGMLASLNEAGTIFWVVVPEGEEYPKPLAGQSRKPELSSDAAKLQVSSGMNGLKAGKVSATGNKDTKLNISGLKAQTAYDVYYLAQDKAGNFSNTVKMTTIHTLDTEPPTVTQEFTKTADAAGLNPRPETDIRLVFSESIQTSDTYESFIDATKDERTDLLKDRITLWDLSGALPEQVPVVPNRGAAPTSGAWICFDEVRITMEEGRTVMLFEHGVNINLNSGGTYQFEIRDIADTSNKVNIIRPNPYKELPRFTTVFALVNLTNQGVANGPYEREDSGDIKQEEARIDMSFQLHPMATGNVEESIYYDVFIWSDKIIEYDLYARVIDENGQPMDKDALKDDMLKDVQGKMDGNGWFMLGNYGILPEADDKGRTAPVGKSVHRGINGKAKGSDALEPNHEAYPRLKQLKEGYTYEYAISLTRVGKLYNYQTWSDRVDIDITIPAGTETSVGNLATNITEKSWELALSSGINKNGVKSIGSPDDFSMYKQFTDTQVPKMISGSPRFEPGDTFVTMHLQTDRPGTIYWAIAPVQLKNEAFSPFITTKNENGDDVEPGGPEADQINPPTNPPTSGDGNVEDLCPVLTMPVNGDIYDPSFKSPQIKADKTAMGVGQTDVRVEGLEPEAIYYAYFVLKGQSQNLSRVYCFQFTTTIVDTPTIMLDEKSPTVNVTTSTPADVFWILYANDSTDFYPLSDKLSNHLKEGADEEWKKIATGEEATLLDAMLYNLPGNSKKSYFDEYANDAAKQEILGRIQGEITGGGKEAAGHGDLKTIEGRTEVVDCEKNASMTPETQYYFLAAAKNVRGSIYGFKAVGNVRLPDGVAPKFEGITDYVEKIPRDEKGKSVLDKDEKWQDHPDKYAYNGKFTLTFDEDIYQLIDDGTQKKLNKLTKDNLVDCLSTAGIKSVKATQVGKNITLEVEGARDGAYIQFFNSGYISDASSNATKEVLTIRFYVRNPESKLEDLKFSPVWVATWGNATPDKPKK